MPSPCVGPPPQKAVLFRVLTYLPDLSTSFGKCTGLLTVRGGYTIGSTLLSTSKVPMTSLHLIIRETLDRVTVALVYCLNHHHARLFKNNLYSLRFPSHLLSVCSGATAHGHVQRTKRLLTSTARALESKLSLSRAGLTASASTRLLTGPIS